MFPRKNRVVRWAGVTQLVECDLAKVDVAGSNPVSRSIFLYLPIAMNNRFVLPFIFLLIVFSALARDYKLEPVATVAPGLPAANHAAIQTQGFRVNGASGAWCEIWLAKSLPVGAKPDDAAISFGIAQGTLFGVIRFPGKGADRRGQVIPD